jgi:hypothetical protein
MINERNSKLKFSHLKNAQDLVAFLLNSKRNFKEELILIIPKLVKQIEMERTLINFLCEDSSINFIQKSDKDTRTTKI